MGFNKVIFPSLAALPLCHAEQRLSGGAGVHRQSQPSPCHQATRAGPAQRREGALAAHREAARQVRFTLQGVFIYFFFILVIVCICVRPFFFFLRLAFPADPWRSRWTRRPRERRPSPTTSRSTCSTSSWAGFPPKWSARPTESTSRSRAAYGTS